MKTDRLYNSLVYSLGLHSLLVVAAVIYMIYAGTHYKVTTFEVSLVAPSDSKPAGGVEQSAAPPAPPREEKKTPAPEKPEKVTPKDKREVNDRIAAMDAKRKMETIRRLRQSIDISAKKSSIPGQSTKAANAGGADYVSMIGNGIHEKFRIPESMDKDLVAIINIHIARNGNVTILGFEKKSGNPLFDRAAIKAITDASPLPPPSSEMDVPIRLHP